MKSHSLTSDQRERLIERQNHRCCTCGIRMTDFGSTQEDGRLRFDSATVEHVVPKRWQGINGARNFVITCFGCNSDGKRAWHIWVDDCREEQTSLLWHLKTDAWCNPEYRW